MVSERLRSGRGSAGMLLLALLAIALLLADRIERTGGTAAEFEPGAEVEASVLRVVDGDTIEVDLAGAGNETVRYIGIDTPESVKPGAEVECFGPEAAEANRDLVEGEAVRLRFDRELRDHYGRLLAYVYSGETLVNAALVERGYAHTLEIEPNTAEAGELARKETAAARSGRGLWARC